MFLRQNSPNAKSLTLGPRPSALGPLPRQAAGGVAASSGEASEGRLAAELHLQSRSGPAPLPEPVSTQGTQTCRAVPTPARPLPRGLQGAEHALGGASCAVCLGLAKCCVKVKRRQGGREGEERWGRKRARLALLGAYSSI